MSEGKLLFVDDKVEALSAIVGEARVAGDERDVECHCMGDDEAVVYSFLPKSNSASFR